MRLSLQTFSSLVQTAAASVQAAASQLIDLTVGSTLRAILEANASVGLWMQWLIVQVLQVTRAATSTGADLDSWLADYGVSRLPAVAAAGIVTIGRYTAIGSVTIPVGLLVRTQDGSQTFVVTAGGSGSGYDPQSNGYVMQPGIFSVDVPVSAQTAGTAGNVLAGTIALIVSSTAGIDTVVNAAPMSGGIDVESDAAVRARFQNFLATRSQATDAAIGYAIQGVQQGLSYLLAENVDTAGAAQPGNFVVTVDDGTGLPSAALLAAVTAAVDAVRPVGTTFSVQPPGVVTASVGMTLGLPAAANRTTVTATVAGAVTVFINALPVGAPLPLTRLAQVAYDAAPTVDNVFNITINGAAADLVVPPQAVIKAGPVVVS